MKTAAMKTAAMSIEADQCTPAPPAPTNEVTSKPVDKALADAAAQIHKLQALAERQFRANQALSTLLQRARGTTLTPTIEITPRFARASLAQQALRRPQPASDPAWPSAPVRPARPLDPPVGHEFLARSAETFNAVGFTLFGLAGADLEAVVDKIAEQQRRERGFRPVFLTDNPDFRTFVSRGYAFEYVSRFRDHLFADEARVTEARLTDATAKWGLSTIENRDDSRTVRRTTPTYVQLAQHNAGMSRACHQDRFTWIVETLRLALSNERYDVVEGLADYLLAFFDGLPAALQTQAARVLCRKFVAFGEFERLRTFLFKNIAHARKDDMLFTLFSMQCVGENAVSAEFAKLPSGKPNFYFINRRMLAHESEVMPVLMAASESGFTEANLLMANFFAARGEAGLYRMFLNRSLAKAAGASVADISFKPGNVLDTIRFDQRPPARNQTEKVSVIMSAFNAAATIGYAVRSILGQTWSNLELLVCDDGSTDETPAILAALAPDPRLRIFRSKAQQGTYNIRNALIAEARGRFVTFQDSDDLAFPDRIERQVAFLREHDAAAVVGQWYRVTERGEIQFALDQVATRLAVVSLLAPKAVFERFGPYRAARFGADTEFFEGLRLKLGADAVRVQQGPLIFGLSSPTSLTRSQGTEASEDGFRAPARRAYAAAAARRRHTGLAAADSSIDDILKEWKVLMTPAGVEALREVRP